jgi:peptide/nickel transport system permease protein
VSTAAHELSPPPGAGLSRAAQRRRRRLKLLGRRLVWLPPTLFAMSVLVFAIGRASLSSPKLVALGFFAPEEAKAQFTERFHLDEPLITQYWLWLQDAVQGDFGVSFITRTPVIDTITAGARVTAVLAIGALVLAVVLGLVLGTIGGLTRSPFVARLVSIGSVLTLSLPQFWLGLVLVIVFSLQLGLLPAGGYVPFGEDPVGFFKSMLLPWVTLAVGPAGLIARVVQVRVAEEAAKPHVLTARSLGVPHRRVVGRYVLRNSLVEPTSVIGIQAGYMIGGAFLVEQVFGLQGIGVAALSAAKQGDYPVVQAAALYTTVAFLLISLVVDLLQAMLDVREGEGEG